MKKYYVAKQIAPEYQESPMFLSHDFEDFFNWENVSFFGNHELMERKIPILEEILDCIDDACSDYFELVNNPISSPYSSITEIVEEYFLPLVNYGQDAGKDKEKEWEEIFTAWPDSRNDEEKTILCSILSLLTEREYVWKQITGSCQSDWQYIYYPSDEYDKKAIEQLESEYFNEGTEWLVYEEPVEIEESEMENACEIAEDEDSLAFTVYCTSWNDEEKRKEIADGIGCNPDEVLLFSFDHYVKQPIYRLA